jgi:hypothetical protein
MDYGEVLSKAWKIIWKFKILWIFGILASCTSNAASSVGSGGNNGVRYTYPQGNLPPGIENFFNQLTSAIDRVPIWVWVLIFAVILVFILIGVVLGTVGHIGIIRGTSQADDGVGSLAFGALFSESFRYFWRIFLLNLLVGLAMFAAVILFFVVFVVGTAATLGLALLCLVPLACLFIPASWVVDLLIQQSTISIVVEDLGIMAGLARGWDVIKRNIGPMIVVALILFVGGGIVGLLLALPVAFTLIPALITLAFSPNSLGTGLIISGLVFLVYLPFWLVLAGAVRSYTGATWTLTFRRLTGRGLPAPISPEVTPVEPAPSI